MRPGPKFRPKKADPLLDDSVLDEATRRALLGNIARDRRTVAAGAGGPSDVTPESPAQDEDGLTVTVLSRLAALEKQVKIQQRELQEKATKVISLEDHLRETKLQLDQAHDEKVVLAQRLADVNKFLADYNLTFVGNDDADAVTAGSASDRDASTSPAGKPASFDLYAGTLDPAAVSSSDAAKPAGGNDEAAAAKPEGSKPSTTDMAHSKLPFDLELAIHQADRLSSSIANTTVQTNGKTGIIKERDTVYVCVYSDGLVINSGVFRPYGWPICDAFLVDLLEGYFPYEFREKYPDGFPLEIVDKASEKCPRTQQPSRMAGVGDHGYKPVDRDGLLKKLPQQYVTSGGKLVDVRSGVADFIGQASVQPPLEPQRVVGQTAAASTEGSSPSKRPRTTVRVKFAQGHDVTLCMFHDDTVSALRDELLRASASFFVVPPGGFELCSVYPRRTYDNHGETLAEAGLVPSASLQIKLVQPAQP